jgi:3-hydroxybutyryl-CoA dehydrogenase|tara:strand:+ start:981 stop:1841 length:861 start_codon:yes stop_codon:yes gene_type:complete
MTEKIAVIGGGQMGSQIASLSAMAGYETHIYDQDIENVTSKLKFAEDNLENLISKNKYTEEHLANFKKNLYIADSINSLAEGKTFIIEAVVERLEVKLEIFSQLSEITDQEVVLATNSSFIAASEIAKDCQHIQRFINMHFFYPPLRMDLVEISYPKSTTIEVVSRTQSVGKSMGRSIVTLKKETPGFIVNRMLAALVDEAYELYDEGIADFEDIDLAIKKGLNHPLGPFEISDYSGLDIHYYAKLKIFNETKDPKDYPKKFLEKKIENGDLGVKTGKGFYNYKKD